MKKPDALGSEIPDLVFSFIFFAVKQEGTPAFSFIRKIQAFVIK